jgi:hypothetical protein
VEGNDVDRQKAYGSSVDRSNGGECRSLDVAISVIERTVSLLRSLRARADAALSAGCIQKGALEISAKAAPDSRGPAQAELRESEASSGESYDPRERTDRRRTEKTTAQ